MRRDFYKQYPIEFQNLLEEDFRGDNSYIGQGNPNSKILIIGKECTYPDEYFLHNADIWKEQSPDNIPNWFECKGTIYHPRRPFWGQLLLKDNNSRKNPKPWEKLNRGTSVTWKAQQQFINCLLPEDLQVYPRQQINFYEYCFMTDLSCHCMSISVKNSRTRESIKERIGVNGILTHPFYRNFPVVIFDIYHYFDWYKDLNIIQNFDGGELNYSYKGIIVSEETYSHFDTETKKRLPLFHSNNGFAKGDFINIHESRDGKHVLLHTSHFVDNYQPRSEIWMKELANIVRPYLNK